MAQSNKTSVRLTASIGLAAIIALSTSGGALASTAYTDPTGDALFRAPAYLDIVAGTVEKDAGTFEFTLTVADAIPQTPRFTPPGVEGLRWVFSLDLDPTTFPGGWPLGPTRPGLGLKAGADGFVAVAWDDRGFTATLFDRRPLLSGDEVVATSVPFDIDGSTVTVWLDGALIGDPTSFRVGFVTVALTTELGTVVDIKRLLDVTNPFWNQWP
jgi:hypothetical protein